MLCESGLSLVVNVYSKLKYPVFFFKKDNWYARKEEKIESNECSFKTRESMGCLGGSVGWASNSWFQLRSWYQGHRIETHVGLCAKCGACLGFFLCLPLPHSPAYAHAYTLSLSLSQKNLNKIREGRKKKILKKK